MDAGKQHWLKKAVPAAERFGLSLPKELLPAWGQPNLSARCQPYSYSYYCSYANWSQCKDTFLDAKPILVWQEEISDIFVTGVLHNQRAAAHNHGLDIGQTSGYDSLGFGQKRCEEVWSETQDSCC